jgi:hypothetical protein
MIFNENWAFLKFNLSPGFLKTPQNFDKAAHSFAMTLVMLISKPGRFRQIFVVS